ncbi:unnamed protein product [Caenorhabditis nigoni]
MHKLQMTPQEKEQILKSFPLVDQHLYKECLFLGAEKCFEKYPGSSSDLIKMHTEIEGGEAAFKEAMKAFKYLPSSVREDTEKLASPLCKDFLGTPEYKNGNKDHPGYLMCCETFDYCSFYFQTWFYIVCGAVGLLLLIGIAGGVFFFYRKRKRMGK